MATPPSLPGPLLADALPPPAPGGAAGRSGRGRGDREVGGAARSARWGAQLRAGWEGAVRGRGLPAGIRGR